MRSARKSKSPSGRVMFVDTLEQRVLLSGGGPLVPWVSSDGFAPAEIRSAYDFNNITLSNGQPGNGAGQPAGERGPASVAGSSSVSASPSGTDVGAGIPAPSVPVDEPRSAKST